MIIDGDWETGEICIGGKVLRPARSQRLFNHSPDGFSWGYGGSGPSQLALALLLYYTNSEKTTLRLYQSFKWDIVANLPQADFEIDDQVIKDWLQQHKAG